MLPKIHRCPNSNPQSWIWLWTRILIRQIVLLVTTLAPTPQAIPKSYSSLEQPQNSSGLILKSEYIWRCVLLVVLVTMGRRRGACDWLVLWIVSHVNGIRGGFWRKFVSSFDWFSWKRDFEHLHWLLACELWHSLLSLIIDLRKFNRKCTTIRRDRCKCDTSFNETCDSFIKWCVLISLFDSFASTDAYVDRPELTYIERVIHFIWKLMIEYVFPLTVF